jgi:hypothetical protein
MKKFLFLLFITIPFAKGLSQTQTPIAYYDALFIKQNCFDEVDGNFKNKKDLVAVLKRYYPEIDENITSEKLLAILKANPILNQYAPDLFSSAPGPGSFIAKSAASVGATDVTKIVDGLAKFIVDRTKKELQAAFFDRFTEELKKEEYRDVQTLFPATFEVIKRLPSIVYSYEPYIEELREAFGVDLASLYPHLESVINNGQYAAFFANHMELKSVCLTALYFGNGLKKGTHIGILIEDYQPSNTRYNFTDPNITTIKNNAIQFIQEVSKSFRTAEANTKEYWVSANDIRKKLLDDPVTFNIYLGLLYKRVLPINVSYTGSITYGELLSKGNDANNFISTLVLAIEDAQQEIKNIQTEPKEKHTIQELARAFSASVKVLGVFKESPFIIDFCNNIADDVQRNKIQRFWSKYDDIVAGSNNAISLFTNIKAKNYSLAISNVKSLYQLCFDPRVLDNEKKNDQTVNNKKIAVQEAQKRIMKVIDFLSEKGAFIASVAKAKNSTEVYQAIDKFAAPVGSSRVKRLSNTNVAVNAYCGFFAGQEQIKGVIEEDDDLNTYGLAAPVGFSFSKGNSILPWPLHQILPAKGWSSTLFLSVIDIGAVAAYRFSNETAEQVPTIQLKDIFSPGIFWSVGIPKTPLSISFGVQVGPNLRKVNDASNDYSNNTYVRYSAAIVVDIPILNLFTK